MNKQIEQKIKATEGARNFNTIIQEISTNNNKFIFERNGDPVAAIVPIEVYEQWKKERKAFFQRFQEVSENINLNEQELNPILDDAIKSVRNSSKL